MVSVTWSRSMTRQTPGLGKDLYPASTEGVWGHSQHHAAPWKAALVTWEKLWSQVTQNSVHQPAVPFTPLPLDSVNKTINNILYHHRDMFKKSRTKGTKHFQIHLMQQEDKHILQKKKKEPQNSRTWFFNLLYKVKKACGPDSLFYKYLSVIFPYTNEYSCVQVKKTVKWLAKKPYNKVTQFCSTERRYTEQLSSHTWLIFWPPWWQFIDRHRITTHFPQQFLINFCFHFLCHRMSPNTRKPYKQWKLSTELWVKSWTHFQQLDDND